MADNQRGQRGQNQNQDMNRRSGSNLGNNQRSGQQGRDQNIGLEKDNQKGIGRVGNTAPERSSSENTEQTERNR